MFRKIPFLNYLKTIRSFIHPPQRDSWDHGTEPEHLTSCPKSSGPKAPSFPSSNGEVCSKNPWTSWILDLFSIQPGIQPVRSPEFFPVCDQLGCPHEGLPSLIQLVSKGPVRNLIVFFAVTEFAGFKQSKSMLILKDGHNYDIWAKLFYLNNWQEMDLLSEICLNEKSCQVNGFSLVSRRVKESQVHVVPLRIWPSKQRRSMMLGTETLDSRRCYFQDESVMYISDITMASLNCLATSAVQTKPKSLLASFLFGASHCDAFT